MVTFFLSVAWIAIFSYVMVWMVAYIGHTLHIPDTIMGITFLAAGTSVPDAIASLLVAREGNNDKIVDNNTITITTAAITAITSSIATMMTVILILKSIVRMIIIIIK